MSQNDDNGRYNQFVSLERATEVANLIIGFLESSNIDPIEGYAGLRVAAAAIEKMNDIKSMEITDTLPDTPSTDKKEWN